MSRPLPDNSTLPSTAATVAVEMLLWAQMDLLLEARTEQEIDYFARVLKRRLAAYRIVMEHPAPRGLPHKPKGEYK